MKRRQLLGKVLGATALTSCASTTGSISPLHTFVLQHGAWHGGWCWDRVATRLRGQGHRVLTPTATGLGERAHLLSKDVTVEVFVQDLVNVLETEELKDVILVGHSFGGIAISGAADRVPDRIKRLVYLDAVILQPGQSVLSSIPREVATQRRAIIASAGGVSLPPPPASFFGISEGADADWLRRRLTPHPAGTYDSSLDLRNPIGNGLRTTYIACAEKPLASLESMRQWARQQPTWNYEELATVHNAMMSAPDALTSRLLSIAHS